MVSRDIRVGLSNQVSRFATELGVGKQNSTAAVCRHVSSEAFQQNKKVSRAVGSVQGPSRGRVWQAAVKHMKNQAAY